MPAWPPPAIRGHPLKRARRLGMGVDVAEAVAAGDGFLHHALLYRGAAELGGKGLWLVNQVCDLVDMRSTTDGTTICLHMKLR
jgi:hypothetical protein